MKKITLITVITFLTSIILSSCSGGYTCPTYSKMDNTNLVKTENQERI